MNTTDLESWLADVPGTLGGTIAAIALACTKISESAALGPLTGLHGATADTNSHGEVQKKFDVFADEVLAASLAACPAVAGWASEESEAPTISDHHGVSGEYLVAFDPLDGSSNIEANISVGTIFSILPHPFRGTTPGQAGFLQPGHKQVAAGYVVYGPSTVMVLCVGHGVAAFTLDRRQRNWMLTRDNVQLPTHTKEFAINCSNQRFWEKPVQRYVAECVAGVDGPRGKDFNMRWVASMVAEVHRIFSRGGVYLYPRDMKEPRKPGRLRLLYEAAPMALLIERAGGAAVTGTHRLLDVVPDTLHQRVPVILGSREEVDRIVAYHADPSENVSLRLFKTRSLFLQPQA